jgi:hypothetical protein
MIIILSFYTINNITKTLLEILVLYSNFSVSENNDYLSHAASINRLRTTAMETWLSGLASTGFGIRLHVHTIGMAYRLHGLKHPPSMIYSGSYKY